MLRAATAGAHARVDRAFSTFDLAQRADYGHFLQAQAAALIPLEHALDRGVAPQLGIAWDQRRRAAALLADLATLGLAVPGDEPIPPFDDAAEALGAIYVLEGSRLGGVVLKRTVGPGLPATFLAPGAPGMWQDLLAALELSLVAKAQRDAAVRAAQFAFGLFERGALARMVEAVR